MPPRCTFKKEGWSQLQSCLHRVNWSWDKSRWDVSLGHFSPNQDHSDGPFRFTFVLCTIPLSSFLIHFPIGGNAMNVHHLYEHLHGHHLWWGNRNQYLDLISFYTPANKMSDYTESHRRDVSVDTAYIPCRVYMGTTVLCKSLALLLFSFCNHIPSSPSGLWVCGKNMGTGTRTIENVVIRVHQNGWLWWWKAAFHCKRHLNHKRVEHEHVMKWYSTDL